MLRLTPPPAVFQLEGRVSVKTATESFSGGMTWHHQAADDTLLLSTPLGQGVAELHRNAAGVSLKDAEGRTLVAEDPETLLQRAIGMALPVTGLTWWVTGQPRPQSPYQAEADADGRLAVLMQDDWRIEFARYARQSGHDLPGKLIARRGEELELRLVVDAWNVP